MSRPEQQLRDGLEFFDPTASSPGGRLAPYARVRENRLIDLENPRTAVPESVRRVCGDRWAQVLERFTVSVWFEHQHYKLGVGLGSDHVRVEDTMQMPRVIEADTQLESFERALWLVVYKHARAELKAIGIDLLSQEVVDFAQKPSQRMIGDRPNE